MVFIFAIAHPVLFPVENLITPWRWEPHNWVPRGHGEHICNGWLPLKRSASYWTDNVGVHQALGWTQRPSLAVRRREHKSYIYLNLGWSRVFWIGISSAGLKEMKFVWIIMIDSKLHHTLSCPWSLLCDEPVQIKVKPVFGFLLRAMVQAPQDEGESQEFMNRDPQVELTEPSYGQSRVRYCSFWR